LFASLADLPLAHQPGEVGSMAVAWMCSARVSRWPPGLPFREFLAGSPFFGSARYDRHRLSLCLPEKLTRLVDARRRAIRNSM